MLAKNGRRVRISSRHSFAICEEIGERLRTILCCTETELPPRLRALMDQLVDAESAPSLVPSISDMIDDRYSVYAMDQ